MKVNKNKPDTIHSVRDMTAASIKHVQFSLFILLITPLLHIMYHA